MVRVSRQAFYLPTPLLTKEGTPLGTTDVLPRTHTISGRAKVIGGIQIIFTRLVDDAKERLFLGSLIRQDLVDPAND
jgi:hypothetical protein